MYITTFRRCPRNSIIKWTGQCSTVHRSGHVDGQTRNGYLHDLSTHSPCPLSVDLRVCPEKSQPFGQNAKQSLSNLVFGRAVEVEWQKHDRYERIVGKVLVNGQDANLEQVRRGMAWHYKKYEREQEPLDRATYSQAEIEARMNNRGLWSDPSPIPPWDWRKSKKN